MSANDFRRVYALATDHSFSYAGVDMGPLDGYGLPSFGPIVVDIRTAAAVLKWQIVRLDGSIDVAELNATRSAWQRKVTLVA